MYKNKVIDSDKNYFPWLDWLRFLAAFAVVLCHGRGSFLPEYSALASEERNVIVFLFYALTRLGAESVILFFVLSGFLVCGRGIMRIADQSFSLKSYAVDRFCRIFPPLFCCLAYVAIIRVMMGQSISWTTYLGNMFSLQGIFVGPAVGPFWSLSYEVWFYVLLGAVGYFRMTPVKSHQIAALIVMGVCAFVFTKLQALYLFLWIFGGCVYFLLPMLVRRSFFIGTLGLFGVCLALKQMSFQSKAFLNMPPISSDLATLLFGIISALLIVELVSLKPSGMITLKIERYGTRLAAFTYTLYLSHVPTFSLLEFWGIKRSDVLTFSSIAIYLLCCGIAMFVAWLGYCCFEKHTSFFKRHLKAYWGI